MSDLDCRSVSERVFSTDRYATQAAIFNSRCDSSFDCWCSSRYSVAPIATSLREGRTRRPYASRPFLREKEAGSHLRLRTAFIRAAKPVSNAAIAPTPPIVHHTLEGAGGPVATGVRLLARFSFLLRSPVAADGGGTTPLPPGEKVIRGGGATQIRPSGPTHVV